MWMRSRGAPGALSSCCYTHLHRARTAIVCKRVQTVYMAAGDPSTRLRQPTRNVHGDRAALSATGELLEAALPAERARRLYFKL